MFLGLLAYYALAETSSSEEPAEVTNEDESAEEEEGGFSAPVEELKTDSTTADETNIIHPCLHKHCALGHECDIDEDNNPTCVCVRHCPPNEDTRAMVCSTQNATFESECELHRQRCLCHKNHEDCRDKRFRHAHLDYYGECKEAIECEEWEREEYPKRMRNWLYLVMEELADRQDLSPAANQMAKEAKSHSRQWVLPVIWKFCDMDRSHDRMVSPEELVPLSAPLKAMEHCTAPFLADCDSDSDGEITLAEWGHCLGLEEGEIEDRCEELRD